MNRQDMNAAIPRISIKGKQYATVDSRVAAFWELFPDGRIATEELYDDGERCVFKACAYDGDRLISTGHASEEKASSYINQTSYLENCETSAVGRALGFLGIGSNGSIASADEVQNAIEGQDAAEGARSGRAGRKPVKAKTAPQTAPDGSIERIKKLKQECIDAGVTLEGVTSWYEARFGGTPLNKLTEVERQECIAHYSDVRDGARTLL